MKLKLIDEDWIDERIRLVQQMDRQLQDNWVGDDEQKLQGYMHSGAETVLKCIKDELKSPKEEIIDAMFHGFDLSFKNETEGETGISSDDVKEYLKEKGYE